MARDEKGCKSSLQHGWHMYGRPTKNGWEYPVIDNGVYYYEQCWMCGHRRPYWKEMAVTPYNRKRKR